MKVAEKIDWLEYSLWYTGDFNSPRNQELGTPCELHRGKFGDALLRALTDGELKNPGTKKLVHQFFEYALPPEFLKYFNIDKIRACDKSISPYRFRFEIGDPDERVFYLLVPLHEVGDEAVQNNYYMIENVKKGCFETLNVNIGYKIMISGHNMPVNWVDGQCFPVRIDSMNWIRRVMSYPVMFKLCRVDIALDIQYHFQSVLDYYNKYPDAFLLPFFKKNRYVEFNQRTGAGMICAGSRSNKTDSYLRIYNKAAEQSGDSVFYPWNDFKSVLESVPTNSPGYFYVEVPWTRFEFELRGVAASRFLCDYWNSLADDVAPANFIFDSMGIYDIQDDQDLKYANEGRFDRLSFVPFWNDVVAAYNLYGIVEDENFVQFREELFNKDFNVSAVGMRFAHNSTPYRTGIKCLAQISRSLRYFLPASDQTLENDLYSRLSIATCSSSDLLEYIRTIPIDFVGSVDKAHISDLKRFCEISHDKAVDLLNRTRMKGFYDEVLDTYSRYKDFLFNGQQLPEGFDPDHSALPMFDDNGNIIGQEYDSSGFNVKLLNI